MTWPQKNGNLPLEVVKFAQDYPQLIEILPVRADPSGKASLDIFFKEGDEEGAGGDIFEKVKNLLHITSGYVIL